MTVRPRSTGDRAGWYGVAPAEYGVARRAGWYGVAPDGTDRSWYGVAPSYGVAPAMYGVAHRADS